MTALDLNLQAAAPEIFILAGVSVVLMIDLFLDDAHRYWSYLLTLVTLGVAAAIMLGGVPEQTVYAFHGMFVLDRMAVVLKLFVFLAVAAILIYSRSYARTRQLFSGEFFALALFATLGMLVMISASHLLTLYLGLELLSLSLYAMVALRRDSATATEAAMKYFVLGALASGMLLYGMSMVYGATGSLVIADIASCIKDVASCAHGGKALGAVPVSGVNAIVVFGLVFIVAGVGFKLGAVPFHMWVPDVYQGAPTPVTLFIGSAPELAAFALAMRLLVEALGAPALLAEWQSMLAILALLSMAVGNITAIAQTNLKRMLAYSAIAHMGFMLLGILAGTPNGYGSAMFYVVSYMLMTLGSFGMIMLLSREGFEAEDLEDFKGLNQRDRWYAFLMMLIMLSLAGLPVMIGFWAKLAVLQAAFQAGYTGLVVAAVLFSLVGAYYYLRVVKLMYFDDPVDRSAIVTSADQRVVITVNGLAVLVLGIAPGWLLALCQSAFPTSL